MAAQITIDRVDHIGIRVRDYDRAMAFYQVLGFTLRHRVDFDAVAIIRNTQGVEINLRDRTMAALNPNYFRR